MREESDYTKKVECLLLGVLLLVIGWIIGNDALKIAGCTFIISSLLFH